MSGEELFDVAAAALVGFRDDLGPQGRNGGQVATCPEQGVHAGFAAAVDFAVGPGGVEAACLNLTDGVFDGVLGMHGLHFRKQDFSGLGADQLDFKLDLQVAALGVQLVPRRGEGGDFLQVAFFVFDLLEVLPEPVAGGGLQVGGFC